ncbi:hypothetical protein FOL47_003450 [Perkinsus chesapeaki]|uniref:Uncharacterized protein n=1 Tax=Perkinsus chesapeaki TaxID=330153 RepID=A0A7J6M981_PERCH|nr:hypothetical protein FOL47_003450 [Perkinsus chesapeaki]
MVLLSILWSATCETRTYMGYTDKKQQCSQISSDASAKLSTKVELVVHCRGRQVGSPGLTYSRKYVEQPFVIKSSSKNDLAGYIANVYDQCGLRPARSKEDFSILFTVDNYKTMRVDFQDKMVDLVEGKC